MRVAPLHCLACPNAHSARLAIALILLVLLASCGGAAGRLLISDAQATLDQARIEAAAAPLVRRGAVVAVITVAQGDDQGVDLRQRLADLGLLEGDAIAPAAIALYISIAPRYSELRAGSRWSAALPAAALREIRLASLNPALRADQRTAAVADTLLALDTRLGQQPALGAQIESWVVYAVCGAGILLALWLSPIGARLAMLWKRSPLAKVAQWLWDRTPPGQRSLKGQLAAVELRLQDRATFARGWCQAARSTNLRAVGEPIVQRLKLLDLERTRVTQTVRGRRLLVGLAQLAESYAQLGRDAERLCPQRPTKQPAKRTRSSTSDAATETARDQGRVAPSDGTVDWDAGGAADQGSPSSDGGPW
ncbi:MAG: hypothetical protein H7Y32_05265 [Chloroflexales bacterium]|nr:hypothetical protein [Chloroflexales bacterium]